MESLTGNEKVKVLLAQCLFGNPDVILMDVNKSCPPKLTLTLDTVIN